MKDESFVFLKIKYIDEIAKWVAHCGPVKLHVVTDIGAHGFRLWFGACKHQSIISANSNFCEVYISMMISMIFMGIEILLHKFHAILHGLHQD